MTHIPKGPGSELPLRGAVAEVSQDSGKPGGKLGPSTKYRSHAGHMVGGCSQLLSLGSLDPPLSLLFLFLFPSLFCVKFILCQVSALLLIYTPAIFLRKGTGQPGLCLGHSIPLLLLSLVIFMQ